MNQLTWPDIFVDALSIDARGLLSLWPKHMTGDFSPIGFSAFGDCFVQREWGEIQRLDVLVGGAHSVAGDMAEFQKLMDSADWREDNLLTDMVVWLRNRGLVRGPGQFFAFAPHPVVAGKLDWDTVTLMDALEWHSVCAAILDGVSEPLQ